MNKSFPIVLAMLVMFSFSVLAASVSRDMPSRVSPGESVTVSFSVSNAEVGKTFTLEDDLPDAWTFSDWDVTGAKEAKSAINHRTADGNRHGWSFTANQANVQIKYTAKASSSEGSQDFDAVWFDSSGQSRDKKSVTVRTIRCGDTVCEGSENNNVCPADCPAQQPVQQPEVKPEVKPEPEPVQPVMQFNPTTGLLVIAVLVVVGLGAFFILRKKR